MVGVGNCWGYTMFAEALQLGSVARLLWAACVGACLNSLASQLAWTPLGPQLLLLGLVLPIGALAWGKWSSDRQEEPKVQEQEHAHNAEAAGKQGAGGFQHLLQSWSRMGLARQRLWAALVAVIVAGQSGCMIYKGSYGLLALLLEVGVVGCFMYLIGQHKSDETMRAIANEAAVRLVALHRQNEGLADEKEELEVELKSMAQHKQPALHAGSPADLILEVLDLMLEGGVPRADDLLLLRDFILSGGQHHDMYQPLDVWQQLHTLTMEPDVEEALCYQLLGQAPSRAPASPTFYSMPENKGLSNEALVGPQVNNTLRSCFSDQLPPSFLNESPGGQEDAGQDGDISAEDGLRNMLAAIACDNSVLEVRRSPSHIASNSSLLQKLSVRGGNSSFTEQAQMVIGPEKLPSGKSIGSHLDRLQTMGRVGSDGSAASNRSGCPSPNTGPLNGGPFSSVHRDGNSNWSSFGTAGVMGFPHSIAAVAAEPGQSRGSREHSSVPVSPTLPLDQRRNKLRTLSALMQAPGGAGPSHPNPKARSSSCQGFGLSQAQQHQQQSAVHIPGRSQPPSIAHSPPTLPPPSSSHLRRLPRPSLSTSNLDSNQQGVGGKPAQRPSDEAADIGAADRKATGPSTCNLSSRKSKTQPKLLGSSHALPRQHQLSPPDFSMLSHTTLDSSSTYRSRFHKDRSTRSSQSDCALPSFPMAVSHLEAAYRRGSLPFAQGTNLPRHHAGSSGSLSRRLSQLSLCQPNSVVLSEGRRASQQSMYQPNSGALSERRVPSEEAVCKDLMLAAQCPERHVLDEAEEVAAEKLCPGSSRSTLPGLPEHRAQNTEETGAGMDHGADLMVVGPRSGSSNVVSPLPRPFSWHGHSPLSNQALPTPTHQAPETAPLPRKVSISEHPASLLPSDSTPQQEQEQLMLQKPPSRLPSKSSSKSMPSLADLLRRRKSTPQQGSQGREEEVEEAKEHQEQQEEQLAGLDIELAEPPGRSGTRESKGTEADAAVRAGEPQSSAEPKQSPGAALASSSISNTRLKSESSCSSKGGDVKPNTRGSASHPKRSSPGTDTDSVVSAQGSHRSGVSSSASQWVHSLLEGSSNSRRSPRAAKTFSAKSPSLEPVDPPPSKPASKAKKGPLKQFLGSVKSHMGKGNKNKDAEKGTAGSVASVKEGSERSTPASEASHVNHAGSLPDVRKGILGTQTSAPAETLDAAAASVIGSGALRTPQPSAPIPAASVRDAGVSAGAPIPPELTPASAHDAGVSVGRQGLPARQFVAASADAAADRGLATCTLTAAVAKEPPGWEGQTRTGARESGEGVQWTEEEASELQSSSAGPLPTPQGGRGLQHLPSIAEGHRGDTTVGPAAHSVRDTPACVPRGSPKTGHGGVIICSNIGSSGRITGRKYGEGHGDGREHGRENSRELSGNSSSGRLGVVAGVQQRDDAVVTGSHTSSSGRSELCKVQGPLTLTELAAGVNARAADEKRVSPPAAAAAAAAATGSIKVPARSSAKWEPGWLDDDHQQSMTTQINEESKSSQQKGLMQLGPAPTVRGGAVRARGSSVLSFEGSTRWSSTFPLEPAGSSTSFLTGSARSSLPVQSSNHTLQSDQLLAAKPSSQATAPPAKGAPQASQSNATRQGSTDQGSLSSFLPQVPEDTQPFMHAPVDSQPTGKSFDEEAFGSTMMFATQECPASKSFSASQSPRLTGKPTSKSLCASSPRGSSADSTTVGKLATSPPTTAHTTAESATVGNRVRGGSANDGSVGRQSVHDGRPPPGLAAEGSEDGSLKAGVSGVRRTVQQQQQQQQQQMLGPRSAPVLEMERMLEEGFESWSFDAFKLAAATQGHPLSALAYFLFHKRGLISSFSLPAVKLARFLRSIEAGYTAHNPYHNATHAANVLQTMHVIIHRGAMVPQFADCLSVMAALLAAIMHDYEHMGLTNDFLVNNSSALAIRYNDRAPLENHHLAAGFTVLHSRDHNFLDGLPKAEYSRLRKIVIDLVLATDMKQHFALVGQFNTVVRRFMPKSKPQEPGPNPNSPRGRGSVSAPSRDNPMGRALSSNLSVLVDRHNQPARRQPAASTPVSGEMFPSVPHRVSMDVTESALSQLKAATQDASAKLEVPKWSGGRSLAASLPSFHDRSTAGDGTSGERTTTGDKITSGENSVQSKDRHAGTCEGPVRGSNTGYREGPSSLDETQKLLLLQIALKCADLGHVAEDHDVHIRWVHALEEEFYRQGDREKAAKLPVSPLFDRDKPGVTKSQVGFFDVVVLPLLQAFTTAVPGAVPFLEKAEQNYMFWKQPRS